jgi:hypothetical protein
METVIAAGLYPKFPVGGKKKNGSGPVALLEFLA